MNTIYTQIASMMYDLDLEVSKVLEADLGRVFTDEREICIRHISNSIKNHEFHKMRSEMALIENMIRTVEDREQRKALIKKSEAIFEMMRNIPKDETGVVDIMDPVAADLNGSVFSGEFDPKKNRIICIGREFGSAGTDIGFILAQKLGVKFYDGEIFDAVSKRLEVKQDTEADYLLDSNLIGKKGSSEGFLRRNFRYHGLTRRDAFFFNQSELICEMAEQEGFVIIGRCADMILSRKNIPHFNIFIGAPLEMRIKRTMAQNNISYRKAKALVKKMDRRHARYYNFYTMKKWGAPMNYDLCINSSTYGIEGSVNLIYRLVTAKKVEKELDIGAIALDEATLTEQIKEKTKL